MLFLKKLCLYFSAFIPLYALLIIKIAVQIINKNLNVNVLNTCLLSILSLLIGLGILGLMLCLNTGKKTQIKVITCKNITENHFLGYFSLFVLFALSYEIEYVYMATIFALILVFVGVVYIRNNLFYINPLLNILGFSFYKIEYTEVGLQSSSTKSATIFYFGNLKPNNTYFADLTTFNFNLVKNK